MRESFSRSVKSFFTEPRWAKVRDLFWFFVITLGFHVLWRIWANDLNFFPLNSTISSVRCHLVQLLYKESSFIIKDVLNISLYLEPHAFVTKNGVRLVLGESAAGLKQIFQFIILILIFRGSWANKLWYIPLGIIVIHLTNIFRMICMVVIAMHWPMQIQYAHDNYLRILYYVVIFGLWMIWMEKVSTSKASGLFRKR